MFREISLDAPCLGNLEKEYLDRAVNSGYVSTVGPYVPEFEREFADYVGVPKAVAVQSGTAALHMALYELRIKPGDEVIVPALTFIATVNPVVYLGATPVFADVDFKTWTVSAEQIERKISDKTKAVVAVHLYGNPCDLRPLTELCQHRSIALVEDATESLGAKYAGRHTGTFGDFGCFSFNGNKVITTGGGGMVVGRDEENIEHIKFLVNQARDEEKGYYHPEIGFNYRMTNIEASLGLAQMRNLSDFLKKKKQFFRIYKEVLGSSGIIDFQHSYECSSPNYWLCCVMFECGFDVTGLQRKLRLESIPTRRVFMPIVEFPPYSQYKVEKYLNSYGIYERGLCMPSSTLNSEDDIYRVAETIKSILNQ